ncbi:hypothetical protein BpHYR1_006778 [Brachionus plicatilis]|uniref:Uncharacterized protein n=1 Tax=Brachionus plicatilis TaxID=10195 RepID=A0A3M7SYU1_BRAPC|nr:hypothetical protein BpHYR1_006778 [Brachionus plicatilis]
MCIPNQLIQIYKEIHEIFILKISIRIAQYPSKKKYIEIIYHYLDLKFIILFDQIEQIINISENDLLNFYKVLQKEYTSNKNIRFKLNNKDENDFNM